MNSEVTASVYRGHQRQFQYAGDVRDLACEMRAFPELGTECTLLEKAVEGIVQPFSVAVFGRMKTGKSSIINAFLGLPLTITGVNEATATINHISYASGSRLRQFRVHWKDAEPETLPIEELQNRWNGTGEAVLSICKRTDYLELYADIDKLKSVNIIDTPGTGSTAQVHEDIARQFIGGQETDALVYVCSYEVRDTDLQDLRTFSDTCLSAPTPYNCIALLHKWDLVYWNNGGNMTEITAKASHVYQLIGEFVTSVLPVSAPLAYAAKVASADFWQAALSVLDCFEDEEALCRQLRRDEKWNRNSRQAELYAWARRDFDMPWDTFRVMLRHMYRMPQRVPEACADAVMGLSGFQQLENALDKQFFMNRTLIKQRQVRARVRRVLDQLYEKVEGHLRNRELDLARAVELKDVVSDEHLKAWLELKAAEWEQSYSALRRAWVRWDYRRREISDEADMLDKGIEARRWLDSKQPLFTEEQFLLLRSVIDMANGVEDCELSMPQLQEVLQVVSVHLQSPHEDVRRFASFLRAAVFKVAEQLYSQR